MAAVFDLWNGEEKTIVIQERGVFCLRNVGTFKRPSLSVFSLSCFSLPLVLIYWLVSC